MTKSLSKDAIFYIKYYAMKYGETIERKATLDDNGCGVHYHKKFGYPYYKYVDVWAEWEINNEPTLEINHVNSALK